MLIRDGGGSCKLGQGSANWGKARADDSRATCMVVRMGILSWPARGGALASCIGAPAGYRGPSWVTALLRRELYGFYVRLGLKYSVSLL
jgi:hypothetical protein